MGRSSCPRCRSRRGIPRAGLVKKIDQAWSQLLVGRRHWETYHSHCRSAGRASELVSSGRDVTRSYARSTVDGGTAAPRPSVLRRRVGIGPNPCPGWARGSDDLGRHRMLLADSMRPGPSACASADRAGARPSGRRRSRREGGADRGGSGWPASPSRLEAGCRTCEWGPGSNTGCSLMTSSSTSTPGRDGARHALGRLDVRQARCRQPLHDEGLEHSRPSAGQAPWCSLSGAGGTTMTERPE